MLECEVGILVPHMKTIVDFSLEVSAVFLVIYNILLLIIICVLILLIFVLPSTNVSKVQTEILLLQGTLTL